MSADGAPTANSEVDVAITPAIDSRGDAHIALSTARHDLRHVLQEASSEFESVTSSAEAVRSQSAHWQELPPGETSSPAVNAIESPGPFETSRAAPSSEASRWRGLRALVIGFAAIGIAILIASRWWVSRPINPTNSTPAASAESGTPSLGTRPVAAPADAPPA